MEEINRENCSRDLCPLKDKHKEKPDLVECDLCVRLVYRCDGGCGLMECQTPQCKTMICLDCVFYRDGFCDFCQQEGRIKILMQWYGYLLSNVPQANENLLVEIEEALV